jgi:plasmid maintenance system antidote protein VapI
MILKERKIKEIKDLQKIFEGYDHRHEKMMVHFRFMAEVERLMIEQNRNKKELAQFLNTSPSFVTQLFQGDKVLNLDMIARLQHAFNYTFDIQARKDLTEDQLNLAFCNEPLHPEQVRGKSISLTTDVKPVVYEGLLLPFP